MDIYYKEFDTPLESDEYLIDYAPEYYIRTVLENGRVLLTSLIYDETSCPMLSAEIIAELMAQSHWARVRKQA